MLLLLLFNTGGYQLLFQYLLYRADNIVNQQINNNGYKPTDLSLVKIPVHLNVVDWDDFKPISGELKIHDRYYNYAELKITRDTIYLMCLYNNDKPRLLKAGLAYARDVNDIPQNKKNHDTSGKKPISLSDYNCQFFTYNYTLQSISFKLNTCFAFIHSDNPFIESPGKPPNATC